MSKKPNIFGPIKYSRHDIFINITSAVRDATNLYIMIEADKVIAEKDKFKETK